MLVLFLLAVAAIYVTIGLGAWFGDASPTPRLALDLEGGTQIILTPKSEDGQAVTAEDLDQAIGIIRQRIDSSGVSEAEITSQGGRNIVVSIPGTPDQATLDLVRTPAQLRFRPVLVVGDPAAIDPAVVSDAEETAAEDGGEGATPSPTPTGAPTQQEIEAAALAAADVNGDGVLADAPATTPTDASDLAWITEQVTFDFYVLDCTDPANRVGGGGDDAPQPLVSCDPDGTTKYILGPVEIEGTEIASASSGLQTTAQGVVTNEWIVQLEFSGPGSATFSESTQRLVDLESPRNQFAIVLDGLVVSAPVVNSAITNGSAEISGSFTRENAATLANQLNFGSLPLAFEVQSEEQISATLGAEQLQKGLLAGALGLVLVVLYTIGQYRGLAVVTVASLLVAAVITYGVITLLSWLQGYRLSLAGVAGLIVAIGITADSFIVYFERIRDEVREGRYLEAAVDHGWRRARRTILASDAVNFLAAVVLYLLAVGGVRGFAFTLGLTTLVDLLVVFAFTHPLMQLLIRTRFYGGGHRLSGLDPVHLGATASTYRGRGQFRQPGERTGQTIAERRAAERNAALAAGVDDEPVDAGAAKAGTTKERGR